MLWCLCAFWAVGCLEQPVDLKPSIELLVSSQGRPQEQALQALCLHGRAALLPLETVLHRNEVPARKAAVLALRRLGLAESAPLLAHVAAFDPEPAVAAEARAVLQSWSSEHTPKGHAARAALGVSD